MSHGDEHLERLLARGNLSGAAYDRIESNVMRRVLPRPRAARAAWLWAAVLAALVALSGLVAYRGADWTATDSAGFTAKGSLAPLSGAVELTCSAERPCRPGDTLMFVVDTSVAHGYLNASAQRVEPRSSERIHFFPTERGESPRIEPGVGTKVVSQGLRLAGAFSPGVYRVDIWFTDDDPSPHPNEGRLTTLELTVDD